MFRMFRPFDIHRLCVEYKYMICLWSNIVNSLLKLDVAIIGN